MRWGSTGRLSVASETGSDVALPRICVRALSCPGSRCCTRTKLISISGGKFRTSSVMASNPPADAPIPTIGKPARGALAGGDAEARELDLSAEDFTREIPYGPPKQFVACPRRRQTFFAIREDPRCSPISVGGTGDEDRLSSVTRYWGSNTLVAHLSMFGPQKLNVDLWNAGPRMKIWRGHGPFASNDNQLRHELG